jgi:hypothetical protein
MTSLGINHFFLLFTALPRCGVDGLILGGGYALVVYDGVDGYAKTR